MAFAISDDAATLTMVSAGLAYEIIAASCSSPQTTEINAGARADTLMKWVNIGVAQAAFFAGVGVAIQIARGQPWWPVVFGTGLAIVLLYIQYIYAKRCGLEQPGTPTETYEPAG